MTLRPTAFFDFSPEDLTDDNLDETAQRVIEVIASRASVPPVAPVGRAPVRSACTGQEQDVPKKTPLSQ